MTSMHSDEELAKLAQQGDTEQFGALVERYEHKLLRYGRKFLSDHEDITDIVQDVFLRAYQGLQGFDTRQKFSPWIYRIAHNAYVSALAKKSRNPLVYVDFDTFVGHAIYEDPLPREREQAEMSALLAQSLEKLQPKYREVLVLYYLEEMPYKDIAEVLQVPQSTVGVRIKRAKEALKATLPHPYD